MTLTQGDQDCQGAVFIFKDDTTAAPAWNVVLAIDHNHGAIRGELHDSKSAFLSGLDSWNKVVDPDNAYLCIYAHGTKDGQGICPRPNVDKDFVSWVELAAALPNGVECIWLVGCITENALRHWTPLNTPVRNLVLTTNVSRYFAKLVPLFQGEISLNKITYYDRMPEYMRKTGEVLGCYVRYFRHTEDGFVEAFRWQRFWRNVRNLCCIKRTYEWLKGLTKRH